MKTLLDVLTTLDFFKKLTPEQLEVLAENAKYRRYRADELIFKDGNLSSRFYVVVVGKVALEATDDDGRPVQFQVADVGELLGWSWMFSNALRGLRARALEPTEVVYFTGGKLRQQCDQDPALGYHLFRQLADVMMRRLQTTRQLVLRRPARAIASQPEWRPGEGGTSPAQAA